MARSVCCANEAEIGMLKICSRRSKERDNQRTLPRVEKQHGLEILPGVSLW